MSWIARLAFVPVGISIVVACTVVDTIKAQNTVANAAHLRPIEMTAYPMLTPRLGQWTPREKIVD
jgi:hypothetical protein